MPESSPPTAVGHACGAASSTELSELKHTCSKGVGGDGSRRKRACCVGWCSALRDEVGRVEVAGEVAFVEDSDVGEVVLVEGAEVALAGGPVLGLRVVLAGGRAPAGHHRSDAGGGLAPAGHHRRGGH